MSSRKLLVLVAACCYLLHPAPANPEVDVSGRIDTLVAPNEVNGVVPCMDGRNCDDGYACTIDVCRSGVCVFTVKEITG